ncbi:hypothetical protein [Odoribacter lunatus]|uniref:hypothetical protein n=1 Tax=Odoribacter lunatus TaxID=2941335 RepID=UPI00203C8F04|nr:hypothetical protein [Odoribacter lunatus]
MEQWKNGFSTVLFLSIFLLQKIKDMFSIQKEYVFDAKRGSFCTKKSLFFSNGVFIFNERLQKINKYLILKILATTFRHIRLNDQTRYF